jgi:hypothetical protein
MNIRPRHKHEEAGQVAKQRSLAVGQLCPKSAPNMYS